MTFENMRTTLKKLFTDCDNSASVSNAVVNLETGIRNCKVEPVLESEAFYSSGNFRRSSAGGRGRGNRGRFYHGRRGNPVGADGRLSTCFNCGSKNHWARSCPDNDWRKSNETSGYYGGEEEVHVTLLAAETDFNDNVDVLFGESLGAIILDSGCSKTVCGQQWLESYLETDFY